MKNRKRPSDGSPVRGRTAIRLRQIYRIYPNRTYPTDKASRIPARPAERRPVPCGRADRMLTQRFGRGGAVSEPQPHRRSSGQGPTAPSGRGRRTFPFPCIRAGRLPYTAKKPLPARPISALRTVSRNTSYALSAGQKVPNFVFYVHYNTSFQRTYIKIHLIAYFWIVRIITECVSSITNLNFNSPTKHT